MMAYLIIARVDCGTPLIEQLAHLRGGFVLYRINKETLYRGFTALV